jgi:hypothetical protein
MCGLMLGLACFRRLLRRTDGAFHALFMCPDQHVLMNSPLNIVLVILLVILLIGLLPAWPYSAGWGYFPSGGLGLVLLIALIVLLTRRKN